MGMSFGLIVQGPSKKINKRDIKDASVLGKNIMETIDTDVVGITAKEALTISKKLLKRRILKLAAVFFDRVCSRTPMDEDYQKTIIKELKDGSTKTVTVNHHADKDYCRLDWEIQIGPRTVTSEELWRSKNSLFEQYNNSKDIDYIYDFFEYNFGNVDLKYFDTLQVENKNNHFAILEYGDYKNNSMPAKGKKYEHGVLNHHSVQAPNGMMRLTLAELDRIANSNAVKNLSRRYRSQRTSKVLNATQLKSLKNALQQGKNVFTLRDIDAIIGSRAGETE